MSAPPVTVPRIGFHLVFKPLTSPLLFYVVQSRQFTEVHSGLPFRETPLGRPARHSSSRVSLLPQQLFQPGSASTCLSVIISPTMAQEE